MVTLPPRRGVLDGVIDEIAENLVDGFGIAENLGMIRGGNQPQRDLLLICERL